jgi:hypothetical protein
MTERCKFDIAWVGRCNAAADDSGLCEKHRAVKCTSCQEQATGECCHTGQFVCGAPLCDNCTGWSDNSKPSGSWGFMNHRHVSKQWLAQRAKDQS